MLNNNFIKRQLGGFMIILSLVALGIKFPYMINAWRWSPIEYGGWFLIACTGVALASGVFLERYYPQIIYPSPDEMGKGLFWRLRSDQWIYFGGWVTAFLICLYFIFGVHRQNMLGILCAVGMLSLSVLFCFGPRIFLFQMPTLVFFLLSVPSFFFWMMKYMRMEILGRESYFFYNLILGVLFYLFYYGMILICRKLPRISTFFFSLILLAGGSFLYSQQQSLEPGAPLSLDFAQLQNGEWLLREDRVSSEDKKFFAGCSEIIRVTGVNPESYIITLKLKVFDIRNLHPMRICLESGSFHVLMQNQTYLEVDGEKIQCEEMRIQDPSGNEFMAYSIYSNEDFSIGDFVEYRFLSRKYKLWDHYQLVTPLQPNLESARQRIISFLSSYKVLSQERRQFPVGKEEKSAITEKRVINKENGTKSKSL